MTEERILNLAEMLEYMYNNAFFFFGAGNQGRRWAYYIDDFDTSNCLGYIENNTNLFGQYVEGYKTRHKIVSLPEAINHSVYDTVSIIATTLYYEEVLKQVSAYETDKHVIFISADKASEEQLKISDYPGVVRESDEPLIPKTIHYAWFGKEMPDKLKRNIEGWHKMCPDYEIKKWDDSNYDVSKNRYMLEAYEAKKWGFVPDFLRLDVIYEYGGIYLDTDIEIVKKLDDLRYQKCFGCCEASFTVNLGSGFGARAGNDMIRDFRDYYDGISFIKPDGTIDNTSCNTHQYHIIRKYGFRINDLLQCVNGMHIYPMVFQGANMYTGIKRVTDKTYWIHYGNLSWM